MQNPLKPSYSDFRYNSTERTVIQTIERVEYYGLIKDWRREVQANEKVHYVVFLAEGPRRERTAKEMLTYLDGLIDAYRMISNGIVAPKKG